MRRTYGQGGRQSAVGSSSTSRARSASAPRNGFYRGQSEGRSPAVGRSARGQASRTSATGSRRSAANSQGRARGAANSQGRARGAATGRDAAAGRSRTASRSAGAGRNAGQGAGAARRSNRANNQGFVRGSRAGRATRHTAGRGASTAGRGYQYGGRYGRHYGGHYNYHGYYRHSGFHVGFHFGFGAYWGWRCYWPYYNYYSGCHRGFFYPWPTTYCYVPYGFYGGADPVYVTRYVYVTEEAPQYEVVEAAEEPEQDATSKKVAEPKPAADSPVTEKYLREASELFHEAKYLEAAKKFRLAAISSPDNAAPYFALGQALIGMGSYEYASKVIRKAVQLNPDLVREPGDIVGVYQSQDEFDRVTAELEKVAPKSGDARFLVGVQRYFSGDPRAREAFAALAEERPDDELVKAFRDAVAKRFAAEAELPPLESPEKQPK
ncbi:MAG: tetratricopeptide repeat protein [Planctomycetota bacterium]